MDRAPEQSIVDQLEAAGYSADTIISYLEARVADEWAKADFAECGPGEKMVFGVCRKVGGEKEEKPELGPDGKPKEKKEEKEEKSPMEAKLEKAAKAQGSDVTNNKKVVIDGKSYGWAVKNGKPIMVEWGTVAGIKKVGTGEKKKEEKKKKRGRGGSRSNSSTRGQIEGLRTALERQTNDAAREAIMDQIRDLGGQV